MSYQNGSKTRYLKICFDDRIDMMYLKRAHHLFLVDESMI